MNARAEPRASTRDARLLQAVRAFAILALAFSSAAAVEYYAPSHALCGRGSGCAAVRESSIGRSIGVALPALGMIGFVAVVLATLSRRPRLQLSALAFAITGGIIGLGLLGLQAFVVRAFCALCVGADACAFAAGACAWPLLGRARSLPPASERSRALCKALLVLAALAPPAWAASRPSQRPAYVRALSAPGKINVIEFSDFECPFCRGLHPVLKAALAPYGARVHFVRKTFPLAGHVHSREAARAYRCALAQGRGEELADWLFTADDVAADKSQAQADVLGLDGQRFAACVADPATEAAVARDAAAIEAADFQGLPTIWLGAQRIIGFDPNVGVAPFASALERAAANADTRMRAKPLLGVAALALLMLWPALRRR